MRKQIVVILSTKTVLIFLLALTSVIGVEQARGAVYLVTSNADPGDGVCDSECTLREAVNAANANPGDDFIRVMFGKVITLSSALPDLSSNIVIEGSGVHALTIRRDPAAPLFRIFRILPGVTVSISDLTLTGGRQTDGSGIFNEGNLTLTRTAVSHNDLGGGIYNLGTLTLVKSFVSGNDNETFGGGIRNENGTVSITDSSISFNRTGGFGGGISNFGGQLKISNSIINGNVAGLAGGGIITSNSIFLMTNSTVSNNSLTDSDAIGGGILFAAFQLAGAMSIYNSTITGNSSPGSLGQVGGILIISEPINIGNTIVAGNSDNIGTPDVLGPFNSLGNNLIGNTAGSSGWTAADLLNISPLLGPLQDNGGPTFTHAPLQGSPAINAGSNANALDANGSPLINDQRGSGFKRISGGTVDIGAFEVQQPAAGQSFGGFLRPISSVGLNSVNAGGAVPIKFSLGGDFGLGIFAAGSPRSGVIDCDTVGSAVTTITTVSAGGSSLSYDPVSNQYSYIWKTDRSWAGSCRRLTIEFTDGSVHSIAFQFN